MPRKGTRKKIVTRGSKYQLTIRSMKDRIKELYYKEISGYMAEGSDTDDANEVIDSILKFCEDELERP